MDPGRSEETSPEALPDQHAGAPEPESPASPAEDLSTLPESGGETTLAAIPVDPYVVHCQWDLAPADIENAKRALGVGEHEVWPVLQFYDVTNAAPEEAAPGPSFAVEVQLQAGNWFVRSCGPDRAYRADLTLKREDGSFAVIASANPVQTPPSAPSSYADEHWLPIRLDPRQPESAISMRSPFDLALEPPSGAPGDSAGTPVRLPIDMSEEVRCKLTALYGRGPDVLEPSPHLPHELIEGKEGTLGKTDALPGDQERETLEPPLPGQSQLPIDMREEVRKVLTQLYSELEVGSPAPFSSPLFIEEPPIEHAFREAALSLERKRSNITDLTELNERGFTSGISSRTK